MGFKSYFFDLLLLTVLFFLECFWRYTTYFAWFDMICDRVLNCSQGSGLGLRFGLDTLLLFGGLLIDVYYGEHPLKVRSMRAFRNVGIFSSLNYLYFLGE